MTFSVSPSSSSSSSSLPAPEAPRILTELDHARLTRLLALQPAQHEGLQALLDEGELVDPREVAPDVVTMNSRVCLAGEGDDPAGQELTLSYPLQARPSDAQVSVLSPVGASLLGARVGQTVRWRQPDGASRTARIVALAYQPEAAGDYLR
ncbi:MAG: GreA/GreB family elongation factor [Bordetella sp.]|nr:GreA/GreB family elongation factor [Pseudomonadota bacterium]MDQ8019430.1 GreA/GreB family elongation factor [Pseudomonadota bacterium]